MFDVVSFLEDYNISYKSTGKNCSPDFYQTKCLFCDDPSHHLGWHKKAGYLNCWLCGVHNLYEVSKKLGLLWKDVNKYTCFELENNEKVSSREKPKFIDVPGNPLIKIHKKYLSDRGFDPDYLEKKYKLLGTGIHGEYNFRIIAPIFSRKKIVSYQGRDITGESKSKYKACKKEKEIDHHKNILYNIDNCRENWIIVTEGMTDVWRIGDNCCSTFGVNYSIRQLYALQNYDFVFIFFDNDVAGMENSKKLSHELDAMGKFVYNINGYSETDPGDMSDVQVKDLLQEIEKITKK